MSPCGWNLDVVLNLSTLQESVLAYPGREGFSEDKHSIIMIPEETLSSVTELWNR